MATNLTAGADQRLDTQLDNVLQEYLLAKGSNHEVRQMFKAENLYEFEYFVGYEVEDLEAMKRTQNNTTKVFSKRRVTMIYNVIRYYKFLQSDTTTKKLAKDPENWDKDDFDDCIDDGRHPTLASAKAAKANPTLTGTITASNTTVTPATVCPHTKKAENAWLSW